MCAMVVLAVVRAAVPTAAVRGLAARAPSGIRYVNTTDATIGASAQCGRDRDLPAPLVASRVIWCSGAILPLQIVFNIVNFYFFETCCEICTLYDVLCAAGHRAHGTTDTCES